MFRILGGVLALLVLARPVLWADDNPKTPKEQYEALLKQQTEAMKAFTRTYREARTPQEKNKLFQEKYPNPAKVAPKFFELAETNPQDPVAVDALIWVVSNSRGFGKDDPRSKALTMLRDHIASDKIGRACLRLSRAQDKQALDFLREVLAKNKHQDAQGLACLTLGQALKNQADAMPEAESRERENLYKESGDLLDRAVENYADVKLTFAGTVGQTAKIELFEMRFLKIGLVAPDIEGVDFDGKKFQLTDYRGKVVMLDFWGNW